MKSRIMKGFSLVELMIVIVIMAILTGFVAMEVIKPISDTKVTTLRSNIKAINDAIANFNADRGYYPARLIEITQGRYPYIEKIPEDPTTNSDDWEVRPAPFNVARNKYDTAERTTATPGYPHASSSDAEVKDDTEVREKWQLKNWDMNLYTSKVTTLDGFDVLLSGDRALCEEDFANYIDPETGEQVICAYQKFIQDLNTIIDWNQQFDADTNTWSPVESGKISKEAANVVILPGVSNLPRSDASQAIDGLESTAFRAAGETAKITIDLGQEFKISSIEIFFESPPDLRAKYIVTKVTLLGAATEPIAELPYNGEVPRTLRYSIQNTLLGPDDYFDGVEIEVKGVDCNPTITEINIWQYPDEVKSTRTYTYVIDNVKYENIPYKWENWKYATTKFGIYKVRSGNPTYYDIGE